MRADRALLGLAPGARVLDAGCGFGRTVGVLARAGLRRGRRRHLAGGDRGGRAAQSRARRTSSHDLTQPLPDEVARFDAIVNVYSSFGYGATVEDDAAVLRTWHAALRPGGALVMELSDIERSQAPARPARRPSSTARTTASTSTSGSTPRRTCCTSDTGRREQTLDVDTRLYEAGELAAMVEAAGFRDVARYGGFDGHPKQPTDRLVLVARA